MQTGQTATLAVDVMGGDHGAPVMVAGALMALEQDASLELALVGDADVIHQELAPHTPASIRRVTVVGTESVLEATASPRAMLRQGPGTSLWQALLEVAEGRAAACVSADNTAALMLLGRKILGPLSGIRRPALMSQIPMARGMTGLLDLGANLEVTAEQLFQFALMGSVVQASSHGSQPLIGLLNVGHEQSKGHSVVREAHDLLEQSPLNYHGYIEGHDLFAGRVDVAVCDGFAGNLILKASEGLASMLLGTLRSSLQQGWRARLGSLLAGPSLRRALAPLNPDKHNGAPLLGLNGVVVKSHGRSGVLATANAVLEAGREVKKNIPERISEVLLAHPAED